MSIYHLTTMVQWQAALEKGTYSAPSLEMEGFIHCSHLDQLIEVANALYQEVDFPVVLKIDPDRLDARLVWESPGDQDPFSPKKFPHVYGAINIDAVLDVISLEKGEDGRYLRIKQV